MPAIPAEQNLGGGVHTFEITHGAESWVVTFVVLTGDVKNNAAQEFLDETRAAVLQLLPSSKLVSSVPWNMGGHPGITCVIDSKLPGRPAFLLKMNALVTPDRVFSFSFASRKDLFVETQADAYLSTFRLR
jgi:hypothetical protein